jgi:hypothetical protein
MRICGRCTKDACNNHLCERCVRCSDCCECEVTLAEPSRAMFRSVADRSAAQRAVSHDEPEPVPLPDPEPNEDRPNPEPDPFPDEEPRAGTVAV